MSTDKRQLVWDALNNRDTERVPVGFWFHFASEKEFYRGLDDEAVVRKNIDGHLKFYEAFKPDFVKLMSDGFFGYPNAAIANAKSARDLAGVKPIGSDHPWIEKQVSLAKSLTAKFASEVFTFYNIFGPATTFKFLLGNGGDGNRAFADLIAEDPKAVRRALDVIANDLSILAGRVIEEGGADGIYLSVQNVQDNRVSPAQYRSVIAPSEKSVLRAANRAGESARAKNAKRAGAANILHICGYEGSRNDLSLYRDYGAKAINWAVTVEGVSLAEGKRLFGGKAVIGGFANGKGSLIHAGSRESIEAYAAGLLSGSGRTGVIVGADCTVPSDIDLARLEWVRAASARRA
jgi:uroporphyrinogen decarboxylase